MRGELRPTGLDWRLGNPGVYKHYAPLELGSGVAPSTAPFYRWELPNQTAPPNRRARFPFVALLAFHYRLCAPPLLSAAVAHRKRSAERQRVRLAPGFQAFNLRLMSVQEIKEKLAALHRNEQDEVIAYLFHLRHGHDREYESRTARRLKDKDPSHWLSPDAFERKLGKKETP